MPRFRLLTETVDKVPAILWCMEVGEGITLAGLRGYEMPAWTLQQAVNKAMRTQTPERIWNDIAPGKESFPDVIAATKHDAILRGLVWLNESISQNC